MQPKNQLPPRLPSQGTEAQRQARAFQLSLARTAYNYVRSYPDLDAVPLCAGVPAGEEFSAPYSALVLQTSAQIAENYLAAAIPIIESELAKDVANFSFTKVLGDLKAMEQGLPGLLAEAVAEGPTAFLKSSLFDLLRTPAVGDTDFLAARSRENYGNRPPSDDPSGAWLIRTLPTPQMLAIDAEPKAWMPVLSGADRQCEQDWFFGYLQVAGFNTTNLRRVVHSKAAGSKAILWSELQARMSIPDQMRIQSQGGDKTLALAEAITAGKLYACDYTVLLGPGVLPQMDRESELHGKHRYLPAPIALFYWNDAPPPGQPQTYGSPTEPDKGVLQPIAIQLGQGKGSAIFTPNDCLNGNDANLLKWKIAKYFVNVACAIQHESVAHLGDCHLIMESIAVATHRQLATQHPLYALLDPHLRFTISINNGAANNLIVPGGVVAANVGPNIHWTLAMVNEARKAWRWDENSPEKIFGLRGVDKLPRFAFRDDTLLLWQAIKAFVTTYVNCYYASDAAVAADTEVSAWIDELCNPQLGNLSGLAPPTTRDELAQIVAQMIYIAGPLHASVNYGQYPLGAYMPSVAATIYQAAPTQDDAIVGENACLAWFPPLDVALYTLSFEYLLSSIQFDVLGHYSANSQYPYFADRKAETALEAFQAALAQAEVTIYQRNLERPMPYLFQLPSKVPNGISI